jgi:hypothetical protein
MYISAIFLLLCIHAYKKEISDQKNSYLDAIPNISDTRKTLLKKFRNCLKVNNRCIKWRRSMLFAVSITIVLFLIVHFRFPEPKEVILYIFTIYVFYYIFWTNFVTTISVPVEKIGNDLIRKFNYI